MTLFIINLSVISLRKNHIQPVCFLIQGITPVEHTGVMPQSELTPTDVSTKYVILTECYFTYTLNWSTESILPYKTGYYPVGLNDANIRNVFYLFTIVFIELVINIWRRDDRWKLAFS